MQDEGAPNNPDELAEKEAQQSRAQERVPLTEGEDYYYEGPYMVFTAQYHLKRGTCCHSGCRHCPYNNEL